MTINQIARILKLHNIPYYIKDNNIYADDMQANTITINYINVTTWTKTHLFQWLGY